MYHFDKQYLNQTDEECFYGGFNAMSGKLLIVDDEIMLTGLLGQHFEENGYQVWTACSSREALNLLSIQPDLILLDINMPGMDGMELCRIIRRHVQCPIVFLTARITEQDKINGLRIGGDDYITKPFSLQELTARVEAHLRREERGRQAPELMTSHGLIVNLSEGTVFYEGKEIFFSRREFDIMELLLGNAGYVFDKEHIYESVWGFDAEGDSNVVKEHIRKIRMKLRETTGRDYIETVWGMGYRWER